ncbi:MAG TPA: VWA domain-containing protein [Treponema sp.]|nr:VWA domain-containing protein [Treponema sp.]
MKTSKNRYIGKIAKIFVFCSLFILTTALLFSDGITITQIDTSQLLSTQTVRIFVDFNIPSEQSIDTSKIAIRERADDSTYRDVRITSISRQVTRDEGISFLLLLDNSGSMWDDLDGNPTTDPESMRITHAKRAITEFVANLSPRDRAGLAVFNTNYILSHQISNDTSALPSIIDKISKPARDDGYTELYGAITTALNSFGQNGRRNVLIVLSDGEHFPFNKKQNAPTADDGINSAIHEGITCHVVNFGNIKDNQAPRIAKESGGLVFNAKNDRDLLGVYTAIRESILNEYAISYTASMLPGDKRYINVSNNGITDAQNRETERYYYSGTILGTNTKPPRLYYLFFLIIPILLWLMLLLLKLEKPTTEAGIQLLYGAKGMSTQIFPLNNAQTIIGGSNTADITIAGNPAIKENAATIVFDKKKGDYTIAADSDMTVNNTPVKIKKLEPGDVINISGTVVVFNDPSENKK